MIALHSVIDHFHTFTRAELGTDKRDLQLPELILFAPHLPIYLSW